MVLEGYEVFKSNGIKRGVTNGHKANPARFKISIVEKYLLPSYLPDDEMVHNARGHLVARV